MKQLQATLKALWDPFDFLLVVHWQQTLKVLGLLLWLLGFPLFAAMTAPEHPDYQAGWPTLVWLLASLFALVLWLGWREIRRLAPPESRPADRAH